MTFRPLLSVDFDGVLHSYSSGWQGASKIPDPPVPGAMEWLGWAVHEFRVAIFSTRSRHPLGRWAMKGWLREHLRDYWYTIDRAGFGEVEDALFMQNGMDASHDWADSIMDKISWPWLKPSAWLTIDDRALTFSGRWQDYDAASIRAFRPWNKKP